MALKIHVYTICWNESSILPHFLRYYSAFCDKIVVYDNCSTDNSKTICEQFPKVLIKSFHTNNQIRDDVYLKIKNDSWKNSRGQCDFVIVCDVDEFVYHPSMTAFLGRMYEQGTTLIKSVGYNMVAENFRFENGDILDVTEGSRAPNFDKVNIFNPNLIEEINYDSGCHNCSPMGILQFNEQDVKLLHYKFLGLDYVLNRYRNMGSRLSSYNKQRKLGFHYLFSSRQITKEYKQIWSSRQKVI